MKHLEALGLTPETLLDQLRQAWHARTWNATLAWRRGERVDQAVDLGLMNHVLLLDSLAELAGIDGQRRLAAMNEGKATGNVI